jgi:hypothetical protein
MDKLGYKIEPVVVADAEQLSAPMMLSHPPQVITCNAHATHQQQQVKGTDNGFPLNLTTVTKVVSFLMCAILIGCGYVRCNDGTFQCNYPRIPDISHVMGQAPLNKLYAIMLTAYAANKQAYVRAQHQRLQGIASQGTLTAMLIYAALSCIFGPMIGFFDVYYDMHVHCFVVALFCVGEVLYVLTMTAILNSNRAAFPQAGSSIDTLVTCRAVTVVLGVVTLGAKVIGADIGNYGGDYIEWILFNLSFYIFGVLAEIMPYDAIVVPDDSKDE